MTSIAESSGCIARLIPSDADRYYEHLMRLDSAARKMRFFEDVSEFHIALHAGAALSDGRTVIGFIVAEELRGACELMMRDSAIRSAEAAFSIEADWRAQGVGSRLMARMIEEARRIGIRRIELSCLKSNIAMQSLAARFTADLRQEDETTLAVLEHWAEEPNPA